jgi:hypothetical protein
VATKPGPALTLHDRLSQLDFDEACRLLGPGGATLIRRGGQLEPDALEPVPVTARRIVLRISRAEVTLWLADDRPHRLRWRCSECRRTCEHIGAALSAVLEDKVALGLAEPPAGEANDPRDLVVRAIAERADRARSEKMAVRSADPSAPWRESLPLHEQRPTAFQDSRCRCRPSGARHRGRTRAARYPRT